MARRTHLSLSLAALLASSVIASARPSTPAHAPLAQAREVTLGQATVPLFGPWKFNVGDSPIDWKTGKLLWAEPEFDDSKWETVDLTPVPGTVDPYNGDPRYVPGWTAKGHPGYMGWAWYRLRVPVAAREGERLALESPIYVDDGYQVFANGELLSGFGKFGGYGKPPIVYSTAPAMILVPQPGGSIGGAGPIMQAVAFRVWMGPMGLTHSPYAGGLHYAPMLGVVSAIEAQTRLDILELDAESSFAPFEGVLLFLLGAVAAGLILFDHADRVYLWIAGVLLFTALSDGALTVFTLTQFLSLRTYFMFFDVFSNPLQLCGWIMVWWYWFRLNRPAWLPKTSLALLLFYMVTKALGGDFFYGVVLHPSGAAFNLASVVFRLLFLPLLIFVITLGIRKEGVEGWLVLPAVLPLVISQFSSEMIVLDLPVKWAPFGITIFVSQVSNLVSAAAISLLLLRRLLLSVRRQRLMALDVKQAQEVQQVILPEAPLAMPGLTIESDYRPAREVGGDFFQIIPHKTDGSLLIVVGDVTGKGLKAGMLVALLVGAIRTAAEMSDEPEAMLATLNRRLMGRGDAHATCIALRIASDGAVTLVNAGHLAPYLNGEPIAMDGALPLGLTEKAQSSMMHFQLKKGDRLMLMSDGITEATDADGSLFGFERVNELMRTAKSVAEIAGAAQAFGQEDDISVISVTRTAGLEVPAT
jgi:Stage II sporulation protein E (SpoIIE)